MRIDTVQDLLDALEDFDPSTPVRLAMQPNYPMTGSLRNVCVERGEDDSAKAVWLACSGHEDYGCPREAWDECEFWPDGDEEDGDEEDDDGEAEA